MAAFLLPTHALNNTKTLTLSRPISALKTLSLSPSFSALSPYVCSFSCLGSSSLLNPIPRKASWSHRVYRTQGPTPQELKLELSTVNKLEKWMDEAVCLLYKEMWEKVFKDYEIADDLLWEAKQAEIWTDDGEVEITDDEIETAVRAIKKLADWSKRKLKELSKARLKSELQELKAGKYQILMELIKVRSWVNNMEHDMAKTDEKIGKEIKENVEKEDKELEAPEKLKDETTEVITERKLEEWMEQAVTWLEKEEKEKIQKDYKIAEGLLSEARDTESYAVYSWDKHERLRQLNIVEISVKKLVDWSARKVKELSELPRKSKLQELRERKDAILKELPEMMKPHELKEQKTAFIQMFDKEVDVLDTLKDQEMVWTNKTIEELGEAYETAKKLSDEADEAFVVANMVLSFFRSLSEKQEKAVKKLVADWSDQ